LNWLVLITGLRLAAGGRPEGQRPIAEPSSLWQGRNVRLRLGLATVALALLGALPASADAAILYQQSIGAEVPPGGTADHAFTPATSGTARTVSVTAQTYLNQTARYAVEIRSSQTGQVLATGQGGVANDSSQATLNCMELDNDVQLNAGTTYWVRFVPQDPVTTFWNYVRIDDVASCSPHAVTIPVPGGPVDDMYAKPGGTSFQTISVGNDGLAELRLTGASFTGTNASSFRLLEGEPGGPEGTTYTFPKTLSAGASGVLLLYVTCDGAEPQGERTATLHLSTNDPTQPTITWPVWCLVDSTPPTIAYTLPAPPLINAAGWSKTIPTPFGARGVDPESGNRVKRIFCSGGAGSEDLDFDSGSITTFNLSVDGVRTISCQATDLANNTSDPSTITVKVDGTQPDTAKVSGPDPLTNAKSATFNFTASDATSGVKRVECSHDGAAFATCPSPQTRSNLAEGEHTFRVRATDVADNVETSPATWTWRIDSIAPTAVVDEHPPAWTRDESATFEFSATNAGHAAHARFECKLDDNDFDTCPSPLTFDGLDLEQEHSFTVRSIDVLGNVQDPPTVFRWTVSERPLAVDDSASTGFGTPVDVAVLANDVEPSGGALSIVSFEPAASRGGAVTPTSTGLGYTPPPGFTGTDTFVYRLRNDLGKESDLATVTIAVGGPKIVADDLAPVITKLKVNPKKRRAGFVLSEAATVTATITKRARKPKKRKRTTLTRQAKVGPNAIKLPKRVRAGRYRMALRAVDAAGNRSKLVSARFRLKR
jgi:hypothetical protein